MTESPPQACVGAVLFTDLVGFTEFNNVAGDNQAVAVLDFQTQLATNAIAAHGDARVVKELGDGLMFWFTDAAAGLDIALQLMHDIAAARETGAFPLAVRMGIHYGDALERGNDIVGNTINIGARVADLAGPGELLVSENALAAASKRGLDHLQAAPVGPVRVKGVAEPIWLQRVTHKVICA